MPRFEGLDRLRGVALWAMLLHHLLSWTIGDGARALLGTDAFAVTDLAAPIFTVAAGAAAALTARKLRDRLRDGPGAGARQATRRALSRWLEVGAWGVGIGLLLDFRLDSVGVLEVLALSGVAVTVVALLLAPSAAAWSLAALALTAGSGPVIEAAGQVGGLWLVVFGDQFPLISYLALAAWGAAIATLLGERESPQQLTVVAAVAALALVGLTALNLEVWPVARYPSGPAFLVPGLVGTLAIWAVLSHLRDSAVSRGMARAGQRTLAIFVGHYVIRLILDAFGWTGQLSGVGWTLTAAAIAVAIAVASAMPWSSDAIATDRRDPSLTYA